MSQKANEVIDKMRIFREMLLLPKPKDLDFENWLLNFQDSADREIAAHILQHFIYISDDWIDQMLRTVLGRCGNYFTKTDPEWTHDSFKEKCWYSFVQGENTDDATDSGYIFTRKLREVLNIPEARIVKYDGLFKKLEEFSDSPQNVILVDDFVGSGAQTDSAWNDHRLGSWNMTLNDHQLKNSHRIVYAPLIANSLGLSRIEDCCPNLHMEYIHCLGPEYNLFNIDGIYWNGDYDMYARFVSMMYKVAREQGIPVTDGDHVNDVRGFGEQGLTLAFSHGIPDACPAFFYWETANWKPLKKRPYHR